MIVDCDPASQILQHYSSRILELVFNSSSVQLLHTEGLIMEESQKKIERCGGQLTRDILMDEILGNVVEDHSKLIKLCDILMESKEGVPIAKDMIKDCMYSFALDNQLFHYSFIGKSTIAPELNSPVCSPSVSSATVTVLRGVAHPPAPGILLLDLS